MEFKTSCSSNVITVELDSGLETLAAARPYWQQAQERTKELFTEEEFLVLRGALQKIESIGQ